MPVITAYICCRRRCRLFFSWSSRFLLWLLLKIRWAVACCPGTVEDSFSLFSSCTAAVKCTAGVEDWAMVVAIVVVKINFLWPDEKSEKERCPQKRRGKSLGEYNTAEEELTERQIGWTSLEVEGEETDWAVLVQLKSWHFWVVVVLYHQYQHKHKRKRIKQTRKREVK